MSPYRWRDRPAVAAIQASARRRGRSFIQMKRPGGEAGPFRGGEMLLCDGSSYVISGRSSWSVPGAVARGDVERELDGGGAEQDQCGRCVAGDGEHDPGAHEPGGEAEV